MPDRTITFGGDASEARYRLRDTDPSSSGDLVIERLDGSGNIVDTIAEWDDTDEEWVFSEFTASQFFGSDVLNAAENQILVTQGDGTLAVETQAEGPNPYDQAQTFAESDVQVTLDGTQIANGSIELGVSDSLQLIDDFESGDLVVEDADWSDWSGDTGDFSAQQSTVLSGSFSGELVSDFTTSEVNINRDTLVEASTVELELQAETVSSTSDAVRIQLEEGTSYFLRLEFRDDGNIYVNDSDSGTDWSAGVTYQVRVENIDYSAETLDVVIDGTTISQNVSFFRSVSGLDVITLQNVTLDAGGPRSAYIDDLQVAEAPATFGNALIEWGTGIPTDIFSWDVATFTRTLDGETVTVDVEDGSGSVLLSDIDRNTDISSIPDQTNVKLRVNLSRNDTANNPTLDSAYRSWFV